MMDALHNVKADMPTLEHDLSDVILTGRILIYERNGSHIRMSECNLMLSAGRGKEEGEKRR
jgi:hypothetical protein